MVVPSRAIVDQFAELVLLLGMIAATAGAIAEEVARLMAVEFGEVSERLPDTDVGSSTMPQKRNAKRSGETVIKAAEVRALVPLALEAMIQSQEVDGTRSAMMDYAVEQSCVLFGEMLSALYSVLVGLEIYPDRMRSNLELSGGLIIAEAVMMSLARTIGLQEAHEVVHHAAHVVATDATAATFLEVLAADPRVSAHLTPREIRELLDPAGHSGLSPRIARETSARAHAAAARHRPTLQS